MTAEQGGSLDRLFSGLRRWWAENVVDWEPQPEIGSDDDDTTALADSLNDNPHLDPNRHWQEVGCLICRSTVLRCRATVASVVPFDWQLWEIEGGWTVAGEAS